MPIVQMPNVLGDISRAAGIRGQMLQQDAMKQQMGQREQLMPGKLQQQQLQTQQQQAEFERFTDKTNLQSMAKGAYELLQIKDPVQQDVYLQKRLEEIQSRGGDPRDTLEAMQMTPEQREVAANNVMAVAERMGAIPGVKKASVTKYGQPKAGITEAGKRVYFQTSPMGDVKIVEGVSPEAKQGEVIEALPGGGMRITRGGAKPKRFSEQQAKSGGFAFRVSKANTILSSLEDKAGFRPEDIKGQVAENIPFIGNLLIGEDRQVYNQAKHNFITAVLRLESGAAIGKDEFVKEDKKYFPQAGDGPRVIANKRTARKQALKVLKSQSQGAYGEIVKSEKPTKKKLKYNMTTGGFD